MFTNLEHKEIIVAVKWLCETYAGTWKKKTYNTRSSHKDIIYVEKRNPYECSWQDHNDKSMWQMFHLHDLIQIVTFDLNNTYTTSGPMVFKQLKGAPIGGFLSSHYANIKCAYDEHQFHMKAINSPQMTPHYRALREVDDLLAWAAYDLNS